MKTQLTDRQRAGLCAVLNRVASWTAARFDQWLRHEMGDEDADAVLAWLDDNHVSFDEDEHVFHVEGEGLSVPRKECDCCAEHKRDVGGCHPLCDCVKCSDAIKAEAKTGGEVAG